MGGGGGGTGVVTGVVHPSSVLAASGLKASSSGLNLAPLGGASSRNTLSNSSSGSALQLLLEPSLRRPLVVCVVLMAAQQFSGINNAFNYSSSFFLASG